MPPAETTQRNIRLTQYQLVIWHRTLDGMAWPHGWSTADKLVWILRQYEAGDQPKLPQADEPVR